ncbi:MAG TPA: trans-sialidase [Nitrosopumilus sp.]|nr:trans-sialidase [Nitrosopumilus sp.]
MVAAKKQTKKDLESKIAKLEAKLNQLSTQLGSTSTETKPAEVKPAETKPAEVKPAETTAQPPATVQEALENAYYTAPMTSFHDYRAKVTGYSPAPNRYFVRRTAPVGKVPTSNWNEQKTKVTGYTQPSNQYFATRARLAYHPADKTFGSFSGTNLSVEGVILQAQTPTPEAAKPAESKLPKETVQAKQNEGKSKQELLEDYENDYMQRREQERVEQAKDYQEILEDEAKAKPSSNRGSLPKGFESTPEPEAPKSSKGTLPKGF